MKIVQGGEHPLLLMFQLFETVQILSRNIDNVPINRREPFGASLLNCFVMSHFLSLQTVVQIQHLRPNYPQHASNGLFPKCHPKESDFLQRTFESRHHRPELLIRLTSESKTGGGAPDANHRTTLQEIRKRPLAPPPREPPDSKAGLVVQNRPERLRHIHPQNGTHL